MTTGAEIVSTSEYLFTIRNIGERTCSRPVEHKGEKSEEMQEYPSNEKMQNDWSVFQNTESMVLLI